MSLNHDVTARLREVVGPLAWLPGKGTVWGVNGHRVNVRSASRKSGDKFWFDVTPSFIARGGVDFLLYACGSPECIYAFPAPELAKMVCGASLGGAKQVPNFTIYLQDHLLEPAGRADSKIDISRFFNALFLLESRKAA